MFAKLAPITGFSFGSKLDQLLKINILGQPLTFKTDLDMSEAQAVADYLTQVFEKVKLQCSKKAVPSDQRALLVLTALNITNEYFDLKKRHEKLLRDLNHRSEKMLDALQIY